MVQNFTVKGMFLVYVLQIIFGMSCPKSILWEMAQT